MTTKLVTSEAYVNNIRNFLPEKPNSKTPASEKSKRIFDKVINSPNFIFDKSDKKITDYITTLLSIRPGRTLFKRLLKADKPLKIVLDAGKESCFKSSESTIILNHSKVSHCVCANANGEKLFYSKDSLKPVFLTLAHELIHALHYFEEGPELWIKKANNKNIIDPHLDNLEEQETIIGEEGEATLCENVFLFHFGYPLRVNHRGLLLSQENPVTASECAVYGTLTNLKEMLLSDPSLLNLPQRVTDYKEGKLTPLNAAILNNQMEIVDYLFHARVDVNAQDDGCGTALHAAVKAKRPDLVKVLLEKGANTKLKDRSKLTALELALKMKDDEIAEILAPATKLPSYSLDVTLAKASLQGMKSLIQHGVKINESILRQFCRSDYTEIEVEEAKQKFAILLENDHLNLQAKDTFGESALSWAVQKGNLWQVDALVKKGAEIPPHLKERVEKYIEWYNKGMDRDVGGSSWGEYHASGEEPYELTCSS